MFLIAKSTGETTTTNFLLFSEQRRVPLALTSRSIFASRLSLHASSSIFSLKTSDDTNLVCLFLFFVFFLSFKDEFLGLNMGSAQEVILNLLSGVGGSAVGHDQSKRTRTTAEKRNDSKHHFLL